MKNVQITSLPDYHTPLRQSIKRVHALPSIIPMSDKQHLWAQVLPLRLKVSRISGQCRGKRLLPLYLLSFWVPSAAIGSGYGSSCLARVPADGCHYAWNGWAPAVSLLRSGYGSARGASRASQLLNNRVADIAVIVWVCCKRHGEKHFSLLFLCLGSAFFKYASVPFFYNNKNK